VTAALGQVRITFPAPSRAPREGVGGGSALSSPIPKHPALIRTLRHSLLRSLFETARRQGRKPHPFFLDLFRNTTAQAQAALYRRPLRARPLPASVVERSDAGTSRGRTC
jgi:hypothetical protein